MAFERILVAVDFSRDSVEAFRVAVEMARLHSGMLHVFHVIEAEPVVNVGTVVVTLVEKANDAMEILLESAKSSLNGLRFTTEVTTGFAADEILERARQWKADLIALGSKGAPAIEESAAGGTAKRIAEEAPCSVLVVRR
jgi:nucleotide-binding universal stress UspA family protein